jgi:hypothetical protein
MPDTERITEPHPHTVAIPFTDVSALTFDATHTHSFIDPDHWHYASGLIQARPKRPAPVDR